ncbi:uncharacterized protein K452DRAFT_293846 [Aplosporella prunicola CBS 121167]|uniref:RNA polymerase I-specific transcription initiation factor RRN3 n=1 Tax=Aplosporella prunicola CBS 121167 TaxID=1176127 RepID=A0A6A6BTI1_9PEZI|nr:uncharacterized protein K452DRAFT_293846 [Aplosporella prunicola CBS 121167]KAF2147422.1 hypothetical protein K452DRAFT_293846 [Aplosporella prunicola CBS 121167]
MASSTATPIASLKRKYTTETDSEDDEFAVSQAKRHKVAFDPAVEVRILEDYDEKGLELVREEVKRGIEKHVAGDSAGYDQIKQLFTTKPTASDAPSTKLLSKYVVALISNVSLLNKNCSGLVHAILDCQWLTRDVSFKTLYITLLGSLMSAHGGYTAQVLQMLVKYFIELPSPNIRHASDPAIKRLQLRQRVHQSLKHLLKLIPSASGVLSGILATAFPFSTDTSKAHIDYIQNMLDLTAYAPELKGAVLALITERLVKIDVQIQVDMEDLEEDIEEDLVQEVMAKKMGDETDDEDEADPDDSDNESVSSEDSIADDEKRIKDLKASVSKMDSILDILFEYYHQIFVKSTVVDAEETFELLLSQFANTILPTYRSRHTQFLLFHFGQTSPVLIDRFAGACAHLAFDKTRPQIMRLAAAAYLASFIARGAHVPASTVRDVFDILGRHLDHFRYTQEANCKGPDLRRYGGYYALAQALLYIFCFRWRDLIISNTDQYPDDEDILYEGGEVTWSPGIKEIMTRNIYSKFNPLKVCSPAIVTQFARIAHHLRFVYVYPLLETNKRLRLARSITSAMMYGGLQERETALSVKSNESALQLDAYFPFDPYNLPRSKRWVEGDYNEWKSIPGLDQENEEDSDSESQIDESDDEERYEEGTATEVSG